MHWWHSPCSTKSSYSDDGLSGGRQTLGHLDENGVDQSCLSSNVSEQPTSFRTTIPSGNSALPEPQPLPLSQFQFFLRNNYVEILFAGSKREEEPEVIIMFPVVLSPTTLSRKRLLTTETKQIKAVLDSVHLPFFCSTTFPLQIRPGSGSSTLLESGKVLPLKV
ncbi:hypothetical protein LIER_06827 [Lithospermum erythrorhizon]|uniref:Uncharacterized protein n=1 Tax=Lithospermum erythrorhizon TaxID=34254 RepID=A0AAV3P7S5_LITER